MQALPQIHRPSIPLLGLPPHTDEDHPPYNCHLRLLPVGRFRYRPRGLEAGSARDTGPDRLRPLGSDPLHSACHDRRIFRYSAATANPSSHSRSWFHCRLLSVRHRDTDATFLHRPGRSNPLASGQLPSDTPYPCRCCDGQSAIWRPWRSAFPHRFQVPRCPSSSPVKLMGALVLHCGISGVTHRNININR